MAGQDPLRGRVKRRRGGERALLFKTQPRLPALGRTRLVLQDGVVSLSLYAFSGVLDRYM